MKVVLSEIGIDNFVFQSESHYFRLLQTNNTNLLQVEKQVEILIHPRCGYVCSTEIGEYTWILLCLTPEFNWIDNLEVEISDRLLEYHLLKNTKCGECRASPILSINQKKIETASPTETPRSYLRVESNNQPYLEQKDIIAIAAGISCFFLIFTIILKLIIYPRFSKK